MPIPLSLSPPFYETCFLSFCFNIEGKDNVEVDFYHPFGEKEENDHAQFLSTLIDSLEVSEYKK